MRCVISDRRTQEMRCVDTVDVEAIGKLPARAAIYLWQLRFVPTAEVCCSPELLTDWIGRLVACPLLHVTDSALGPIDGGKRTVRRRFLTFQGVSLGGAQFGDSERAALLDLLQLPEKRLQVCEVLQQLALVAPVLYVGQTRNLRRRILGHCRGGSKLNDRVAAAGLRLDHLSLRYLLVPELGVGERRLLERVITHICLAPLSMQAG